MHICACVCVFHIYVCVRMCVCVYIYIYIFPTSILPFLLTTIDTWPSFHDHPLGETRVFFTTFIVDAIQPLPVQQPVGSALIIFPFRTPEWPKPTRGTMTHGLPLSCLITLLITLHPRSGPTPAGPGPPHPGLCMRRGSLPYIRMRWSQIFAPSVPPSSDSLSSSLKATQKLPWCSGLK